LGRFQSVFKFLIKTTQKVRKQAHLDWASFFMDDTESQFLKPEPVAPPYLLELQYCKRDPTVLRCCGSDGSSLGDHTEVQSR
jgi:hypothetical protein